MKKLQFIISIVVIFIAFSCEKMDDNYKKYLEENKIYSPKVTNLTADVGLRTATLHWTNPEGDLAKKIFVDYSEDNITIEQMVDSLVLENLEIKTYNISVFTIDAFGNYSVPATIQIFPNGEE